MSNQESGVPGGWGAQESSGRGGSGTSETQAQKEERLAREAAAQQPNQWGETPGGGTYSDSTGHYISKSQAQQQGTTDKPGDFAAKAKQIGLYQARSTSSNSPAPVGIQAMKSAEIGVNQDRRNAERMREFLAKGTKEHPIQFSSEETRNRAIEIASYAREGSPAFYSYIPEKAGTRPLSNQTGHDTPISIINNNNPFTDTPNNKNPLQAGINRQRTIEEPFEKVYDSITEFQNKPADTFESLGRIATGSAAKGLIGMGEFAATGLNFGYTVVTEPRASTARLNKGLSPFDKEGDLQAPEVSALFAESLKETTIAPFERRGIIGGAAELAGTAAAFYVGGRVIEGAKGAKNPFKTENTQAVKAHNKLAAEKAPFIELSKDSGITKPSSTWKQYKAESGLKSELIPNNVDFGSFTGRKATPQISPVIPTAAVVAGITSTQTAKADSTPETYQKAYDSSLEAQRVFGTDISEVVPPHSPVKVRTPMSQKGGLDVSRAIKADMEAKGAKGLSQDRYGNIYQADEGFSPQATKHKLVDMDFFNKEKVIQKGKFDKGMQADTAFEDPGILQTVKDRITPRRARIRRYNQIVSESPRNTGFIQETRDAAGHNLLTGEKFDLSSKRVSGFEIIKARTRRTTPKDEGGFKTSDPAEYNRLFGDTEKGTKKLSKDTYLRSPKTVNLMDMLIVGGPRLAPAVRVRAHGEMPSSRISRHSGSRLSSRYTRIRDKSRFAAAPTIEEELNRFDQADLTRSNQSQFERTATQQAARQINIDFQAETQGYDQGQASSQIFDQMQRQELRQELRQEQKQTPKQSNPFKPPEISRPRKPRKPIIPKFEGGKQTHQAARKSKDRSFFYSERTTPFHSAEGFEQPRKVTKKKSKPRKTRR